VIVTSRSGVEGVEDVEGGVAAVEGAGAVEAVEGAEAVEGGVAAAVDDRARGKGTTHLCVLRD